MQRFNKQEKVILYNEFCIYEGSFGEFYCSVILTTKQIIFINLGNNNIYNVKLKDILKEGDKFAVKNCNTYETPFNINIMEITHKNGKERLNFKQVDSHLRYIENINDILNNKKVVPKINTWIK